MEWAKTLRLAAALAATFAIAACTMVIPGAQQAGFDNVASPQGARLYVCETGGCGELLIAVHKTQPITAQEARELERFASSNFGRRLIQEAFAQEGQGRGENNLAVANVQETTIGGRKAISASISDRDTRNDDLRGHLIVVINGGKAEVFVTLSESSSRSRTQAFRLAHLWASAV